MTGQEQMALWRLERDQLINATQRKVMMIYDGPLEHTLLALTSEEISRHKWHVCPLCINDETRMQSKQDKQKKKKKLNKYVNKAMSSKLWEVHAVFP